jgi:hypothetical protein
MEPTTTPERPLESLAGHNIFEELAAGTGEARPASQPDPATEEGGAALEPSERLEASTSDRPPRRRPSLPSPPSLPWLPALRGPRLVAVGLAAVVVLLALIALTGGGPEPQSAASKGPNEIAEPPRGGSLATARTGRERAASSRGSEREREGRRPDPRGAGDRDLMTAEHETPPKPRPAPASPVPAPAPAAAPAFPPAPAAPAPAAAAPPPAPAESASSDGSAGTAGAAQGGCNPYDPACS